MTLWNAPGYRSLSKNKEKYLKKKKKIEWEKNFLLASASVNQPFNHSEVNSTRL